MRLFKFLIKASTVICCFLFLITFVYSIFRLWQTTDKRSALYAIEHSNFITSLIAFVVILMFWNLLVIAIKIIVVVLSNYDLSEKLTSGMYKLGILISLTVAMLYTETPDEFQLLASLISFCLIFHFLVPNDFHNLFIEIFRNAKHKWGKNKNHKQKQT